MDAHSDEENSTQLASSVDENEIVITPAVDEESSKLQNLHACFIFFTCLFYIQLSVFVVSKNLKLFEFH